MVPLREQCHGKKAQNLVFDGWGAGNCLSLHYLRRRVDAGSGSVAKAVADDLSQVTHELEPDQDFSGLQLAYCAFQTAFRFSAKARGPSALSSGAMARRRPLNTD